MKMGIDVGFGGVKGLAGSGKKVEFPSVIGDFHPVRFLSGLEGDIASRLVVEYNCKRKFVGEAALKQSIPQATVDNDRTVTEEGIILLTTAMALMSPDKTPEAINLVVGLPVMHYESLKTKYLNAVKTLHTIDLLSLSGETVCRKYLSVTEAKILPQLFGTLFDQLLNEKGEIINPQLAAGKIGIIDIGYNTLDLLCAYNLEYINPRSTSFSGLGMFTVFQALATEIYRNLGVEIPPERIEPLIKNREIKISGQNINIDQYKRSAFKEAAAQIISRVKSLWPNRWELDRIIITGGGAILLGEYLLTELGQQAYAANNPVLANANGYLKFASWCWKQ